MSRTRRAMLASAFTYLQFGASIIVGIVVVPLVLSRVSLRHYGLWLAAADLIGYIALLDLGVFGVLPWLVAEADGSRNESAMRRALSNALAIGAIVGVASALGGMLVWQLAPGILGLTAVDKVILDGPLLVLLGATVITSPLNVAGAALAGLQDVRFGGAASLSKLLLGAALTIGLLLKGFGLYGIAVGNTVPAVLIGAAAVVRLRVRYPSVARDWPRPSLSGMRWLLGTSTGAWLGGFGWRLLSMSNGLVLTVLRLPQYVPMYACTARLSTMLLQMAWVLPDSGLVGLAQLHGERKPERLRQIAAAMMRLHLIVAGGCVVALLAFNPAFVRWWVSPALYGGHKLNVLLAAGLLVGSFAHGLVTISSVLGRRMEVGIAAIANGILQIALAFLLVRAFGLPGLAAAAVIATLLTSVPAGMRLLARTSGVGITALFRIVGEWAARAIPVVVAAAAAGLLLRGSAVWMTGAMAVLIGVIYIWILRAAYRELPIDPRIRTLLERVRLLPPSEPPAVQAAEQVLG